MQRTVNVPAWAHHYVSDQTDMDRAPQPLDSGRESRIQLDLPDDAYFEYAFLDADGVMHADPEYAEHADNPWYHDVTAVFGPLYQPHRLARPDAQRATGATTRLRVESQDEEVRRATIYTPHDLTGPAPLVVVHDGTAFHRIAQTPALLETLLAEGVIEPARLAFLDPLRPELRRAEYGFGEAYQRTLQHDLLPRLQDEADASSLLFLGASLGGLAALLTSLRQPEQVTGIGLLSPALLGTPDVPVFHGTKDSWVLEFLESYEDALPWRIYQEVGTFDWLHDVNQRVAPLLAERANRHVFRVRSAGHNWTFWRDGLPEALTTLLAP